MNFSLIAAVDKNLGIGIQNRLPWRLKADLKYFSDITSIAAPEKINAVIMGRKTWESLPEKSRPLKGRLNVVLSRQALELHKRSVNFNDDEFPGLNKKNEQLLSLYEGKNIQNQLNKKNVQSLDEKEKVLWCYSLDEALQILEKMPEIDQVFVIGGANVYEQAIQHPSCQKIYLTQVEATFECDAFFPTIPSSFLKRDVSEAMNENGLEFRFVVYEKTL